MSTHTVTLLPGLDAEITQAQRDTIWTAPENSRLVGVGLKSPYLYIPSFAEVKRQTPPRQPPPRPPRTNSTPAVANRHPRQTRNANLNILPNNPSNSTNPEPQFLVQIPPPVVIREDGIEPWTLHCVCEEKTGIGLLVGCEKCDCWQHAICVGLNKHTIPDNYVCEICGNRPIRCKCLNNLNYRFSIIKCSQCGYYVHRRCVGLHYGPLPRGDFICHFCGKSKFSYAKTRLPHSVRITDDDTTFTFTQEKVESIPPHFLNGPFNDFLTIDVAEATLNARDFCESLYDRFRSFFFICHPLNPNTISRKKRHNLFISFINGMEQLCHLFYHLDHQQFLSVFDSLLTTDLYEPFSEPLLPLDSGCEITENTRFELSRITNSVRLPAIPPQASFEVTDNGIFAKTELKQDQFIMLADGLIGDLEEFNYDNGVSAAFFQIADTRLVLDTTHIMDTPLHKIKRSMAGNCTLKIILVGESVHCGLFVGRASLSSSISSSTMKSEDTVINSGDPILFGIDFMPAVLEDVSKWIGWHCPDSEEHLSNRPSRDERDLHAAIRQIEGRRTSKQQKNKKKNDLKKSNRNAKPKKKGGNIIVSNELSLFDLFDSEGPSTYLFTVTEDVEEYTRRLAEAAAPKPQALKRNKSDPAKHAAHRPPMSSSVKHSSHISPKKSDETINSTATANSVSTSNTSNTILHSGNVNNASNVVSVSDQKVSISAVSSASTLNSIIDAHPPQRGSSGNVSSQMSAHISDHITGNISVNASGRSSHNISNNVTNNVISNVSNVAEVKRHEIGNPKSGKEITEKKKETSNILKFTGFIRKQIKEAETARKYTSMAIGDPVETMKRLLNGNS
ncbi:PHD-finger family protein [Tritrichomonas foetus]|uniref:PHD-finger family protein n=1 Tax=Tritrichomonas foetus TaxID=1144522 RepID=A0A1J4JA93_9EUKA|nr:PHD-finger family protein [Tritrichomonas foetus]|eukprot:OHS94180.1 PHD-finger family protein [Tritrichomonas foetus]